jgi:hypothetical protein
MDPIRPGPDTANRRRSAVAALEPIEDQRPPIHAIWRASRLSGIAPILFVATSDLENLERLAVARAISATIVGVPKRRCSIGQFPVVPKTFRRCHFALIAIPEEVDAGTAVDGCIADHRRIEPFVAYEMMWKDAA